MHGFKECIYYNPENAIISYPSLCYIAIHISKNLDISGNLMVQNKYHKTVHNPYLLAEIKDTFPFVSNLSSEMSRII